MLGASAASVVFAVALLASGQNSTITGTLAGQIVAEGFLDLRLPFWARRMVTRLIAIIPAVVMIAIAGEGSATELLVMRSEEHTSELQSLMRNSYAVFCLKKKKHI